MVQEGSDGQAGGCPEREACRCIHADTCVIRSGAGLVRRPEAPTPDLLSHPRNVKGVDGSDGDWAGVDPASCLRRWLL